MTEHATARIEVVCSYGCGRRIEGTLANAIDKVTAALKAEGFGVLSEINVKDTLKKKLDVDLRGYSSRRRSSGAGASSSPSPDSRAWWFLSCGKNPLSKNHRCANRDERE